MGRLGLRLVHYWGTGLLGGRQVGVGQYFLWDIVHILQGRPVHKLQKVELVHMSLVDMADQLAEDVPLKKIKTENNIVYSAIGHLFSISRMPQISKSV